MDGLVYGSALQRSPEGRERALTTSSPEVTWKTKKDEINGLRVMGTDCWAISATTPEISPRAVLASRSIYWYFCMCWILSGRFNHY
ncbi:hypothetical protein J6590_029504 [Homalodisca vitripennis]|nr:hypothetical protein J6590_029504 [Homalodisca vitripennis]